VAFVLTLPAREVVLRGFAGIGDGAEGKSNGVRFSVEVNGEEVWSQTVRAGQGWQPLNVSLGKWAGRTVLLRLVTDSLGDYSWDWAHWGELRLE
ncbi:MAG: NPCBM/NEW2 domain-containing protein, partial [Armatimonadetes bacterium]|nr:NPCBM/NEW2 domain-containing protein [Armatimonadota bacterium]